MVRCAAAAVSLLAGLLPLFSTLRGGGGGEGEPAPPARDTRPSVDEAMQELREKYGPNDKKYEALVKKIEKEVKKALETTVWLSEQEGGRERRFADLRAILDVPRHLYESAELDGASALQRLRWVTLPTISPVILFAVVLGVIASLQYFTQAHVAASVAAGSASQGGTTTNIEIGYPEGSTMFYPILVYNHGFRYFNMGYASAMAMLLLVVAFAVTAVLIWSSRRAVHYQGAAR